MNLSKFSVDKAGLSGFYFLSATHPHIDKNDCLNPGLIFVCTSGLVLLSLRQCSPSLEQWQIGTNKNSLA